MRCSVTKQPICSFACSETPTETERSSAAASTATWLSSAAPSVPRPELPDTWRSSTPTETGSLFRESIWTSLPPTSASSCPTRDHRQGQTAARPDALPPDDSGHLHRCLLAPPQSTHSGLRPRGGGVGFRLNGQRPANLLDGFLGGDQKWQQHQSAASFLQTFHSLFAVSRRDDSPGVIMTQQRVHQHLIQFNFR